jgi:UDP-glucose 4-epimerase
VATRTVLVTGADHYLGRRVVAALSSDSWFDRVIAVHAADAEPPGSDRPAGTEYIRAELRNPLFGQLLDRAQVHTVVHAGGADEGAGAADVLGLLRACEAATGLHRLVVGSSTSVYGAGRRSPAVFTEQMRPVDDLTHRPSRAAAEIEGYLRGFARRRRDVTLSVLRFAPLLGPGIDTWLTRYLGRPVVPTALGFDPALQLLHESDATEVLCRAAVIDRSGVTNVAADGVLTVSQLVRHTGRARAPVPAYVLELLGGVDPAWLSYGRVVDTGRLKTVFGFRPHYTTEQAARSYAVAGWSG